MERRRNAKRFICALLAFLLMLSWLPGSALTLPAYAEDAAATAEPTPTPTPTAGGGNPSVSPKADSSPYTGEPLKEETKPTPTPAQTGTPTPTETPEPTETPAPTESLAPTGTPATSETPVPTETPAPTGTPMPTETPAPELTAAQKVQALIDALPEAETITAENAEKVKGQLAAIDEAKAALTDEELDALDIARYMAAVEAVAALEGREEENKPETLEGTGQYQFDLKFTRIPSDTTVTYTVCDENGNELLPEQTLTVTNGESSATVRADTLPIKVGVKVNAKDGSAQLSWKSLCAAGTWTCVFNTTFNFSWSHDHTGEAAQWVKEDGSVHILTYSCGETSGGFQPHEFANGVCEQCGAEQPVYIVYALLPETDGNSDAECHKAGTDVGMLKGQYLYDQEGLWGFSLPASYQGEIYFQWDSLRFPEGTGTLTLGAEQDMWFYDGRAGDWKCHSDTDHFFFQKGEPCAVCGKTEEYSAYELYAILPNEGADLRCFAYMENPAYEDALPVLEAPMQDMGGYWYCQLTTDRSFSHVGFAHDGAEPEKFAYYRGSASSVPRLVFSESSSGLVCIDHDESNGEDQPYRHSYIDGTCIVCGDSLPLVAAVNGKRYASLKEAWDAAQTAYTAGTPVTITLLSDVTVTESLELSSEAELILEGGEYTVTFDSWPADITINSGRLTLNSGTIENRQSRAVTMNGGSLVMNGGAIKSKGDAAVLVGNYNLPASFTMTGGTIEAEEATGVWGYYGTVTISGGSVYGKMYAVQCNSDAQAAISGGSFRADVYNTTGAAGLYVNATESKVTLSGGTFDSVKCGDYCNKNVGDLLASGYTYYSGDGSEVTDKTGKSLTDVTVKGEASGNLDLRNVTTDQSGPGYSWDADTNTLTLQNANIAGDIIFADNIGPITVQVLGDSRVGGDIKILPGDTYSAQYDITICGPESLYVAGHLGSDGANGNTITIAADADVTAAGGVSAAGSGMVDGTLTVEGTLTAIGNSRPAVGLGKVVIDGGTLNVSGAKGVSVNGTYDGATTQYENAFVMTGGTFNANCTEYNLVCSTGLAEAPETEVENIFVIPDDYLPTGYAAQKFPDGAAVAPTQGVTSAYASGGGSLTLQANRTGGYAVTVAAADGGTAAASAATAREFDKITMTAEPADGWHLVRWEVVDADGDPVKITKNTFVMPASNVTVTPVFEKNVDLANGDVTVTVASYGGARIYNGSEHKPTVTVRYNGKPLAKGLDYTAAYSDNVNAGTATVIITGMGSYQGTFDAHFNISRKAVTAVVTAENKTYDGNTSATLNVRVETGVNGETLTVTGLTGAFENADAGNGKTVNIDTTGASVTGEAGTRPDNYDVSYPAAATADITRATMTVTASDYTGTYDGAAHGITVTVTSPEGATVKYGTAADACTEDSLTYTDVGVYPVYYQLSKANYETFTGYQTVTIEPKNVTNPTVELSHGSFVYDGTAKVPTVTVKDGETVIPAEEYTVSYENNTEAGTATVTISDMAGGNYAITEKSVTFSITQASIEDATVTVGGSYTYTGTAHTPTSVTVKLGEKTLTAGTDYTVETTNNVDAGEAAVTVTGVGNYKDTAAGSFDIAPAPLTITGATLEEKTYDGTETATVTGVSFNGIAAGGTLTLNTDYTATATYDTADAGTNKNATVTVTLQDTDTAKNYTLVSPDTVTVTGTVNRKEITGTVTINGTAAMDERLTASCSAAEETVSYQWYRGDTAIDGATDSTYTLVSDDVGKSITVKATGTGNYTGEATAAPTGAVAKATPTVTTWPTAEPITYGQALSASTLTDGTANVAGSFTWTTDGIKPAVSDSETTEYSVTFTPDDTNAYNTVAGEITLTVNKAALIIKANDQTITYGESIAADIGRVTPNGLVNGDALKSVTLTASTGDVPGGTITPSAAAIENSGTDVSDNYDIRYEAGALTINKSTPTIQFKNGYRLDKSYDGLAIAAPAAEDALDITGAAYDDVQFFWTGTPQNAGTYTLTATIPETDNTNEAKATLSVSISPKEVSDPSITLSQTSYEYDGTAKEPAVTVMDGETVIPETEYTVTYENNTEAGTATVTITDKDGGNYTVNGETAFQITRRLLSGENAAVSVEPERYEYDGTEKMPKVTVTYKGAEVPAEEYVVNYQNNVNAGTATVTVTAAPDGDYEGERSAAFTIDPKPITVTITPNGGVYGEVKAAEAALSGVVTGGTTPAVTLTYIGTANDGTAVNQTQPPENAGRYTVTASIPEGNYVLSGTTSAAFEIGRAECELTVADIAAKTYGDGDFTLTVTQKGDGAITCASDNESVVTVDKDGKVHIAGAGEAELSVTAAQTDNYRGATVEVPVTVNKRPIKVTLDDITILYGEPDPELSYKVTEGTLVGDDTLKLEETVSGKDVGTYDITAPNAARDNPNYEISVTNGKLTIEPRDIAGAQVVLGPVLTANGTEQTQAIQSVTVENSKGEELEVTYEVTGNTGTEAGSYTMTITGTGNFTGTITKTFVIAPGAVQPFETDESGNPILGSGKIIVHVIPGAGVPPVGVNSSKAEIVELMIQNGCVTADELAQVADGSVLEIVFTTSSGVPADDRGRIQAAAKGYTIGSWFDISLYKQMDEGEIISLTETGKPVRLTVQVPNSLLNTRKNVTRTFWIVRCHEGKAEFLPTKYDGGSKTLSFETDGFSSYAIVYKDTTTTGGTQNTATGKTPKTGDDSQIALWATTMLLSTAGMGTVLTGKRKKKGEG